MTDVVYSFPDHNSPVCPASRPEWNMDKCGPAQRIGWNPRFMSFFRFRAVRILCSVRGAAVYIVIPPFLSRCRRMMWLTEGWFGQQFKLLSGNKGLVRETLRTMKAQYEAYLMARAQPTPFWKRLVARCPFTHVVNQQLVMALVESDWNATVAIND